jgi:hypothetical protein
MFICKQLNMSIILHIFLFFSQFTNSVLEESRVLAFKNILVLCSVLLLCIPFVAVFFADFLRWGGGGWRVENPITIH